MKACKCAANTNTREIKIGVRFVLFVRRLFSEIQTRSGASAVFKSGVHFAAERRRRAWYNVVRSRNALLPLRRRTWFERRPGATLCCGGPRSPPNDSPLVNNSAQRSHSDAKQTAIENCPASNEGTIVSLCLVYTINTRYIERSIDFISIDKSDKSTIKA